MSAFCSSMASWFRAWALQAGKVRRVSSPYLVSHVTLDAWILWTHFQSQTLNVWLEQHSSQFALGSGVCVWGCWGQVQLNRTTAILAQFAYWAVLADIPSSIVNKVIKTVSQAWCASHWCPDCLLTDILRKGKPFLLAMTHFCLAQHGGTFLLF